MTQYSVDRKIIWGHEGQTYYTISASPIVNGRHLNSLNGGKVGMDFPVTMAEFDKLNVGDRFTITFTVKPQ